MNNKVFDIFPLTVFRDKIIVPQKEKNSDNSKLLKVLT